MALDNPTPKERERIKKLIHEAFSDPFEIPREWKTWLKGNLESDPPSFLYTDIVGRPDAALTYGTTPPSNPSDEDVWQYPAGATGEVWTFRRNGAYWENTGGPPVQSEAAGTVSTASAAIVDLGGPALTAPFTGDYLVSFGGQVFQTVAGGSNGLIVLAINGVASAYSAAAYPNNAAGGAFTIANTAKIALAASNAIKLYYASSNGATTVQFSQRWINIRPLRVQ